VVGLGSRTRTLTPTLGRRRAVSWGRCGTVHVMIITRDEQ
jgi:hypothetical protein